MKDRELDIETLILERVKVAAMAHISKSLIDPEKVDLFVREQGLDLMADRLSAQIVAYFNAKKVIGATQSIPATWWDHFKLRWFPRWAYYRWPAKFKDIETTIFYVCPHHRWEDERETHLKWLKEQR